MIKIKQFVFNPFQENTWLVYDDSKEAIIIDAGCYNQNEFNKIENFIRDQNLCLKYLVNTHCHIDHILGVPTLKAHYSVEFFAHGHETSLLESSIDHALMFGLTFDQIPQIDKPLSDGQTLNFGSSSFKVIHTPGHTLGGVCIFFPDDKIIFTGDTLFNGSIGRTDLQGGNYDSLIRSIKTKLLLLTDDTLVYPGHGEDTTIGNERRSNPFLVS